MATYSGLYAQYYNWVNGGPTFSTTPAFTDVEANPDFNYSYSVPPPNPSGAVGANHYSIQYTGSVTASVAGTYVFSTVSDDGIRLFVDGQKIIDDFSDHGATTDTSATLNFTAGSVHSLLIQYFEDGGLSELQLGWDINSTGFINVPDAAFTNTIACFGGGTRLRAERGEVAVEQLQVGDKLISALDGVARPIAWIGSRICDGGSDAPVRIRAGAFGEGVPVQDLLLSPDHAVLVEGALIPVRHLVNGDMIVRAPAACTTYWHVELGKHDVVLAEGLPTETFLDTGQRASFGAGAAQVVPHPGHAARVWEGLGCAPLVVSGPVLDAARLRVRRTAVALAA